jgi:uncharacterized protein YaaN involved in tellurite resistance
MRSSEPAGRPRAAAARQPDARRRPEGDAALNEKLEKAIKLGQLIDAKLSVKLERELPAGDAAPHVRRERVAVPLRQRIMDLQQQLVVNQQGVLSIDLIMRNNTS